MNLTDVRKDAWEDSYLRGENHVFQPCDEVVRFVSRYLRRRVDLQVVRDVQPSNEPLKVLDLGCGVGRNLAFGQSMGLQMYGIELSEVAVKKAREWLKSCGVTQTDRVVQGSVATLPWPDGFFQHALSDSVLDSMPYSVAQAAVAELTRVIQPGGYFYCNLIGLDSSMKSATEEIVSGTHEQNTIQSYFDADKVRELLGPKFEILHFELHRIERPDGSTLRSRWHITSRKK